MVKYCVSARQPMKILKQADEISLYYKDKNYILDLIETIPDKQIIIHIPKETDNIDWEILKAYNEKISIMIALEDLQKHLPEARRSGLKFYWEYPVTSFFELDGLLSCGVSAVLIGAPLCFDLKKVLALTNHTVEIRMIPNLAYDAYIPHKDGIEGGYVRPDDTDLYAEYVDTFEFVSAGLHQEAELLNIYKKKKWDGNLNLLITNLNFNVDNRGIAEDFAERRITCGQHCMSYGSCHFCRNALLFCRTLDTEKSTLLKDDN